MSVPAATVLARAPKLFAAAALPIVALWGLSAIPRKRTPEELREEHKEKERRARLLKEMCDSLANSFLGKEDGLENVEKESQIEWEDIHRRCMEVAVTNAEAPELEDGLVWCAKVLIQQLRLTYEKTTAQDDVRYADCKKLDHLWYCEEELRELTRLVKKYSVPADLQTDLKQIAKKCYWVSRMNMLKNMRKAANMILLAKRSLPWLIADMIVAGYMTYWASMKIHYRAQLLSALVSTSSVRSPQFQMAVKSHAVVELFVAVLRTLNQQLSVRSQDLVARDIQGKLYAAIFAKDEHWWSTQTDGGGWALIQLVFFLPKELKEFMRIPRELINAAVQIVTQSRLVREKSSPMLYVLLGLHWANFFGQMGLRWLKQRAGRRLTAKLVEPSQEKFTWVHALRPEFAHMFQSYARGEKERKGIESYLEMDNRRTELWGIAGQIFSPMQSALHLFLKDIGGFTSVGGVLESGALTDAVQVQTLMMESDALGGQMENVKDQILGFGNGLKPLADAYGHLSIPPAIPLDEGIIPKDDSGQPLRAKGDIEFIDAVFTYPRNSDPTLNGASFKVEAGEFVGLTGETGSGKSTTLQLIERFFDVDEGVIKLDGRDIKEYNPRWLRAQIGVVSQSAQLLPLTVRDNLILACQEDPTAEEIKEACIAADIWDSINDPKVFPNGLETRMTTTVSIAGGEKQRICIARAILANAPILFLDEATSALDESTQAKVQAALDKLMVGRTTIAIAHRLSTIKNADRIIALRGKKSLLRHEQETEALEWLEDHKGADAKAALAHLKEKGEEEDEEGGRSAELATTEEFLKMAVEAGEAGGGLSGTVGCSGKHEALLAKPKGSVYRSLWEENVKQKDDDDGGDEDADDSPAPTLQRQTTTTAGKFDVLKQSIGSLKIDGKRKHAIMEIVAKIEADSQEMEQALEESTLEAALTGATTKPAAAAEDADDADGAADTADLVRTLTGGSAKKGLAERAASTARRRWHVAAAAAATAGLRREKTVG